MAFALFLPVVIHLVSTRGDGALVPSELAFRIVLAGSSSGENVIWPNLHSPGAVGTDDSWRETVGIWLAHNRVR